AHHNDDFLETAILNILRGTGRRGLSSLKSTDEIVRPLLEFSKQEIANSARWNRLGWREDPTNADTKYLRNHVRHKLLSRFNEDERRQLRDIISTAKKLNAEIDGLLADLLSAQPSPGELNRRWFISLPHSISREIVASCLRITE